MASHPIHTPWISPCKVYILPQDSISELPLGVQQFPKLRSLLEQLMGEQESSATPNPDVPQGEVLFLASAARICYTHVDNAPGSTDSRGTLSQRSDNANDTDGEHLTRENCKSSVTILYGGHDIHFMQATLRSHMMEQIIPVNSLPSSHQCIPSRQL